MPEKQHYVPRAYLKFFASDGFLFSVKPKEKDYSKARRKHIKQICFENDFYDFPEFEDEDEVKFIERNAFKYESSDLGKVFKKLTTGAPYLFTSEHIKLIEIYLSLKHRNPVMRDFYKTYDIHITLNKVLKEFEIGKDLIEKVSGKSFNEISENVKTSLLNDKELMEQIHKNSIKEMSLNENETINEAYAILAKLKIFVLEPLKSEDYFITSDNPGYSIVDTKKVFNMNLGRFDGIGFPLNSKKFLFFYSQDKTHPLDIKKDIHHLKIPQENVVEFNDGTTFNCRNSIFCEDSEYLNRFTKSFRERHKVNLQLN